MRVRGLKLHSKVVHLLIAFVAPHAGAWIETHVEGDGCAALKSHPMRVRGLKLAKYHLRHFFACVAPHAGAWIETYIELSSRCLTEVAPHAGALVEVQTAIQCWKGCIGVALAVGYETTADGTELHPPLLLCLPSV